MSQQMQRRHIKNSAIRRALWGIGIFSGLVQDCVAMDSARALSPINIFSRSSTPVIETNHLALFVFAITGAVFVVVAGLLSFVIVRYRARKTDDASEPPQVYGSNQIELAWTVIPVLIVVVLFL